MVLFVEQLSLKIDGNQLVNNLSLSLHKGKTTALVGESGSGKSLTALAISQLLPHQTRVSKNSHIQLDELKLLEQSEHNMNSIRGKRIAMIFQDAMAALNPVLTVGKQIMECMPHHLGLKKHLCHQKMLDLLSEVGFKDPIQTTKSYPHQLSGGMRQRAMIALALAGDPDVLIADEPTTALDVTLQQQILALLKKLQQQRNIALLLITHDLRLVKQFADTVVVLYQGKVVESAEAQAFFSAPQHAYSQQLLEAQLDDICPQQTPISETLLTVNHLKVHFPIKKGLLRRTVDVVKAVDDISFTLQKGQCIALVGESGSGKTTTGRALLDLITKTCGEITFTHGFSREKHQIIFQDPYNSLNSRLTVRDILLEGPLAHNKTLSDQELSGLLMRVGLKSEHLHRYPHQFSGGQRQRIGIARALALNPEFIILDEPTSALDVTTQAQILALLKSLQQQLGLSYLLITHDFHVVRSLADDILVMLQGKIVESGPASLVLLNPQHTYTKKLLSDA